MGADLPTWWVSAVASSLVVAVAISVLVPATILGIVWRDQQQRKQRDLKKKIAAAEGRSEADCDAQCLDEEPWCPKLEVKDWKEAYQLHGCPWHFESCEKLEDVLASVWRFPIHKDLQSAYAALQAKVGNVKVAKATLTYPREVHFCLIYVLKTGAELFGGAPIEHAVGLELEGGEVHEVTPQGPPRSPPSGLRRRRAADSSPKGPAPEAPSIPLPCLLPFYRIHDGFGVLMSSKHLPVLLGSPNDSVHGSSYYVYPVRGLQPVLARHHLLKFARVDRLCVACADERKEQPNLVYVERSGICTEDDELPLTFIADTVSNISGQRVVPPPYMGGPGSIAAYVQPAE